MIGVCYFPEHWSRERWEDDVSQMADAGFEYVRMGEFSWGRIEPRQGEFDFAWLDEALELVGEYGMEAILCTPTATPPKWLVDAKPSIRQRDADGTLCQWGSRRFTCFNSLAYREETKRIVRRLTERYTGTSHLAGWQTDNEFGCHGTIRCYCDDCSRAFSEWLRERYDSIADLNDAWGTTFWSQQYYSFEAIEPPGPTPAEHHPARQLAYDRFCNDSIADYNRLQTALICEANEEWFVTHNFMGDFPLDVYRFADDLDVIGWDSYPTGFVQDRRPKRATADELRAGDPDEVGMNHDLYRGAKRAPFWVLEQQPGDVNWAPYAPQPGDGAVRLWAHHAVAHGADAVLYFRWRRCREGQEQYHAGLRRQDGSPDRGFEEAREAAADLFSLRSVDAPVALLHDYESLWATDQQPHSPDWDYWSHLRVYYTALRTRGVQVDIVPPTASLDSYAATIAPTLYLADDQLAVHLERYVESGGHLLLGARTGHKDSYNQLHDTLAPGPLGSLAGVRVERHETLPERVETQVEYAGEEYRYRTWASWLSLAGAEQRGSYRTGMAAEVPAISRNRVGNGTTLYCGCWPESQLADTLVTDLLDTAGVNYTQRLPDGVRVAQRDGRTWLLNFTHKPRNFAVTSDAEFIIGESTLGAFDVAVTTAPMTDIELQ